MEEVFVVLIIFGSSIGVTYLFVSSRHKERMALIEKGISSDSFLKSTGKRTGIRYLVYSLCFMAMGIGLGVFTGALLSQYTAIKDEVAYTGTIFCTAGLGLYLGYFLASRKDA
jgi:hypothetical protein